MNDLPKFEELMKLAQKNPEELEKIRKNAVENLIQNAPEKHQRRLRGIQFQVDMEREKAKNPMDSCVRISRLMHESFSKLRDTLNEAQQTHVAQLKNILNPKVDRADTNSFKNKPLKDANNEAQNILHFPTRT